MQTINDSVFGKMTYNSSWSKKGTLDFLNKTHNVNIVAQAYEGYEIIDIQRENYKIYKSYLEDNQKKIKILLKEYFENFFQNKSPLSELLDPTDVIFERDGSWGILFESVCDKENGVALFVEDGDIKIGMQNEFL